MLSSEFPPSLTMWKDVQEGHWHEEGGLGILGGDRQVRARTHQESQGLSRPASWGASWQAVRADVGLVGHRDQDDHSLR